MRSRKLAVIAGTGVLGVGAVAGVATGATKGSGQSGDTAPAQRPGEAALSGATAAKVRQAALRAVPGGTVLRVESDAGGGYEAHVRKADGTEVEVQVSKRFAVTRVVQGRGGAGRGGDGGHGGPCPGDGGGDGGSGSAGGGTDTAPAPSTTTPTTAL